MNTIIVLVFFWVLPSGEFGTVNIEQPSMSACSLIAREMMAKVSMTPGSDSSFSCIDTTLTGKRS